MALMLHGLCRGGLADPPTSEAHVRIPSGAWIALCSDAGRALTNPADAEQSAVAALAHHRLLCLYAKGGDVVPVRFGATFSGQPALQAYLLAASRQIDDAFSRIAGAQEHVLRLFARASVPAPQPSDGRSFLQQRLVARNGRANLGAEQARFVARLGTDLARIARASFAKSPAGRGAMAEFTALVPRSDAALFGAQVRAWREQAAQVNLDLAELGPWPAYDFALDQSQLAEDAHA